MYQEIVEKLINIEDDKNKVFVLKLCPNEKEERVLGIKIPLLRNLAKEILKKENIYDYLKEKNKYDTKYMEEDILEGLIIGYSKIPINDKLILIKEYIPKINNWLINDTVTSTFKFKEKNLTILWKFILPYLKSKKEYEVRFGVIMLLHNFINNQYVDKVINQLDKIKCHDYYAEMAIAWTLAEIGTKYYDKIINYLNSDNHISNFTYNKTISKMIESFRITKEQKEYLRKIREINK